MIRLVAILLCFATCCYSQSTFSYGMVPQQQQYPMQRGGYPMPAQSGYPVPMQRGGYPAQGGFPAGIPMGGAAGGIPIGAIIGLVGGLFQAATAANNDQKRTASNQQQSHYNPYDVDTAAGGEAYPAQPVAVSNRRAPDEEQAPRPARRNIANKESQMYSEYFDDQASQEEQSETQSQDATDNTEGYSSEAYKPEHNEQNVYHKVGEQYTGQGVRTYYASGPFDKVVDGVPNGIVLSNGNIRSPFSDYTIDPMQNRDSIEGKVMTDPKSGKQFRVPGFN